MSRALDKKALELLEVQSTLVGLLGNARTAWEQEHPGERFDTVAPKHRGRNLDLTMEEHKRLQVEAAESKLLRRSWRERGPLDDPEATHWRGQPKRQGRCNGKACFAKRGGRRKDHFEAKAARWEGWEGCASALDAPPPPPPCSQTTVHFVMPLSHGKRNESL